eukprot:CAMPEP_0182903216 /NCGR_PEP_ID=MMETSP0034_2-20130328/31086_1 /TAXON_ID=156128 /ORGANISM="Nephroselmis pyriformis, Strain CCMP717" /LENGTH=365 /DNA_ID=CAMNT_0025038037 /DNA_START=43 /DNA_END=1140 /DNA_ORIENTATION=-
MGERRAMLSSRKALAGAAPRAFAMRSPVPTARASRVVSRGAVFAMARASDPTVRNPPSSDISALQKCRLITAIKTPYTEMGLFDYDTYDQMVERQIQCGVDGLIVGGTTGEGHLMSWDEHIVLIAHTVASFGDRITVIGNTGSNCTREGIKATQQGFAVGMHCALQINPYYGKTSSSGILQHFNHVLDTGPGIIYNVPPRTAQDITPDLMAEIAKHPNFVGVKECMGNDRIKGYTSTGIECWSGNDDEAYVSRHECGAVGVISVTSNVLPKAMSKLMYEKDDELAAKIAPFINYLFEEPNPIGLNTVCAMTGLARPVFRMPYLPYDAAKRAAGVKIIEEMGKEHVDGLTQLKALEDTDFVSTIGW